jgi:zinc protease
MADRFDAAFRLVAEVIRTPALPPREVRRLRDERLAELLELRSEPRGLADEHFDGLLYRDSSRLSLPEGGSEETVGALTEAECVGWHRARFLPSSTTVIVCGDVDPQHAMAVAASVLGDWQGPPPTPVTVDDVPATPERGVHLLHRADAPQTELRIGHVGLPRRHPDYFDVVVMNAILGGVFTSRINLNLRERNAFTYGAFSSFDWRRDAGPFTVSTAVATAVTAQAIREIVSELERMQSGPPTPDELSLSTSYLEGVFPIRFETTDAIASALAGLRIHGLPGDYYDTYRDTIRRVSAESVMEAARRHLHLSALQILAVGDRDQIGSALAGLGLGPVTELAT